MTAIDIIKALPIDEGVKSQIIDNYDGFSRTQKISVDQFAWTTYFALYDERLKENLGMQFENVKDGKAKFGNDFYKRALKKTDQEMTVDFKESISKHDLEAARRAMEIIIKEIQASKVKN